MIAALFVAKGGVYCDLPDVDPWGEERDARLYAGPWPVVAHPPCQLWTNLAQVNFKRYGGEHNRPGNDGGSFEHALRCVNEFGGVLEHPAYSLAWKRFDLPKPVRGRWRQDLYGPWVCEVAQSAYGHKARKRTWLYSRGPTPPPRLNWEQPAGTHQCGWFDRIKPTLSKREASATPLPFRDLLLSMARSVEPRKAERAGG